MSTNGLTLRWPQRAKWFTIHAGVCAWVLTPRTTRPEKRPHKSGALTFTAKVSELVAAMLGNVGAIKGAPVRADTSRAMPYTLKQCAKLGVSLQVNKVSSKFK